ncbi:hypothetical protein AAFF_G00184430 [Aldrovandia affinis]|uniref:Uncharacterized protein n=1 Tax=Aldrovandia affinis TaxID=143900 RepID=A0AAD7RMJ9_9TELE|nr:hypothetical protein AAFF_G00184430 [Aldrovandia affinis]
MGVHPYISREAVRLVPTYLGLPIDSTAMPSSYLYPAFLPHLRLHPSFDRTRHTALRDRHLPEHAKSRWIKEETSLCRARDTMLKADSQLRDEGESRLPKQREGRRLRDLTEKGACSQERPSMF